jgi:hypothetical protein
MGLFDYTLSAQVEKILPPILRDRSFITVNDDFKVGDPENQYIESLVISAPGHWKEFPPIGVAVMKYVHGTESRQVLTQAIKRSLIADVFPSPLVDISKWPKIQVNKIIIDLS